MEEILEIRSPEQYKALAHPLRQRLLFALGHAPATTSQLAVALDAQKGNVGHHLKVLREAGLVRVARTRQVRGGTEQYYQRTFRRMSVPGPAAEHAEAMFGAVAEELRRAIEGMYGRGGGEAPVPTRPHRMTDYPILYELGLEPAVEKTQRSRGRFLVLQGHLDPIRGVGALSNTEEGFATYGSTDITAATATPTTRPRRRGCSSWEPTSRRCRSSCRRRCETARQPRGGRGTNIEVRSAYAR